MKTCKVRLKSRLRVRRGISLIELVLSITISIFPISLVGLLFASGQYNFAQIYRSTNNLTETQGQAVEATFSRIGRKSDRSKCNIYLGGVLLTKSPGDTSISGSGIEFRYWPDDLQSGEPTEFAYFYADNDKLKVDYGQYGDNSIRMVNQTIVLADNIVSAGFSRTIVNNVEQNSARMNLLLYDLEYEQTKSVKAAVLMRN